MTDIASPVEPGHDGLHVVDDFPQFAEEDDALADAPSGYVSDAELLAWLESKSTSQNDALRAQMGVSTNRQNLIEELSNLKTKIERAGSPEEIDEIEAKMNALLDSDEYEPYAEELSTLFGDTLAALQHPDDPTHTADSGNFSSDVATVSELKERIASFTNKLDKLDGLALVEIQQLVADARETTQLASNVLSSRDQTAGSIIGNIRG